MQPNGTDRLFSLICADVVTFILKNRTWFLNFSDLAYTKVWDGGCASATELYPSKLNGKNDASVASCYEFCRNTENCAYFEVDSSPAKVCHLFPTGMTRSNGYPSVKCYKMKGEFNQ